MNLEESWQKALKQTEIIRGRATELATFDTTILPYIFLAESAFHVGDTVVRKGQVLVERPSLILPSPQFLGFALEQEAHVSDDALLNYLLVRGIKFPSLRYRHELSSLDVREASLQSSIDHFHDQRMRAEDVQTGLVVGPEDAWQLSVLILVGSLVIRSAEGDLRRILEEWQKRQQG